jgi:hypothetical protein
MVIEMGEIGERMEEGLVRAGGEGRERDLVGFF